MKGVGLAGGYNNQQFSDCCLLIRNKNESKQVYVSKFLLASSSQIFLQKFKEAGGGQLEIWLDEDEIAFLEDAIRCLYKENLVTTHDKIYRVIIVAHKYKITKAVSRCALILKNHLQSIDRTVAWEKACEYLELKFDNEVKQLSDVISLFDTAAALIRSKFSSIRDIFYESKQDFLQLPKSALEVVLKNDMLQVDSENSVFYAVHLWSVHSGTSKFEKSVDRKNNLSSVWPLIRFPQMRIQFLLDVVPHVAKELVSEYDRLIILEFYEIAVEYHARKNSLDERLSQLLGSSSSMPAWMFVPRASVPNANKFTIKCEFRFISKLELTTRYYSSPVYTHGYEFYFFLRKQKINQHGPDDPKNLTLAGYLRCTSKILPRKHYLPIRSTVAVVMANDAERRFVSSNVIFEASEKAIGGKLTLLDENWEQIMEGKSPIIRSDNLTAIVTVEFLETDDGCQKIEETLE